MTIIALLASLLILASARPNAFAQDKKAKLVFDLADLTKSPAAKAQLDAATKKISKYAQGNEAGTSIKSASAKNVTVNLAGEPTSGTVNLVFDLHSRHRTLKDGTKVLGVPVPGIVAYDRHDEVVVEYDIKDGTGRARAAKGPLNVPLLPVIPYEVWVPFNIKDQ